MANATHLSPAMQDRLKLTPARIEGMAAGLEAARARALAAGMKASDYLDRNDAYSFFQGLGDLVVPGPTFTNVNDFRALLVL